MKKSLLFSLFFLCLNLIAFAQNDNLENALVVNKNGDSLSGKIIYKSEEDIHLGFTFIDQNKKENTFKPEEITCLLLTDYNIQYEPVSFKNKTTTLTVLAALVIKGPATLYESKLDPQVLGLDEAVSPFYFVRSAKGTFPLLNAPFVSQKAYNKYKGVLNYALSDCGERSRQIDHLRYTTDDLVALVSAYNKCKDPQAVTTVVNTKTTVPAIVSHQIMLGGVFASQMTDLRNFEGTYYSNTYNGGAGLALSYSLEVKSPSLSKRIITNFEFGFVYVRYHANGPYYPAEAEYSNYTAGRIKILAGYILSDSKVQPIIQFGPSLEVVDKLSLFPFLNTGLGIKWNQYFVGGTAEFPFTKLAGGFYSLNLKYTFAQSKNRKTQK